MSAAEVAALFVLLAISVAAGNLLGEFIFRYLNPDDDE